MSTDELLTTIEQRLRVIDGTLDVIDALATRLAVTEAAREKIADTAHALATYAYHRRSCETQIWHPGRSDEPTCDCGLDDLRAVLVSSTDQGDGA